MSKIKALITTLVLATSSAAMAAPTVSFSANASWGTGTGPVVITGPGVRDHRESEAFSRQRSAWIALATPMALTRGRDIIRLEAPSRFNQIRIQSTKGASYIAQVTVLYTDGTRQVVSLNRWIRAGSPLLHFNLNSTRPIDRLLINGSTSRSARYQVFGYGRLVSETPPAYQPPAHQHPVHQPPVYQPPAYQPRTTALANGVSFANTRGSREIVLGAHMGSYNGHEQMITLQRTLGAGQMVDVDLDGNGRYPIARIRVFHSSSTDLIGPSSIANKFNIAAF
jgi:hypothetical protein